VSGWEPEGTAGPDQPRRSGGQRGSAPAIGADTSSQLVALEELESLALGQERGYRASPPNPVSWPPVPAVPAAPSVRDEPPQRSQHTPPKGSPASKGDRAAGRHHASQSRGDDLLRQHGTRFASFSVIGGGIFIAGLVIQAVLTSGFHVASLASYLVQAIVSVESSYFLNRWVTWKGTKTPFWGSFLRFNLQKVVTVTLNLIAYWVLLKVGVEYLLDNVLLTIIFTFVNYIGADRLVFLRGGRQMVAAVTGPLPILTGPMPVLRVDQKPVTRLRPTRRELPTISVVIPVRGNEKTILAAVDSILRQDYPLLRELILVGSPGDSTWSALTGVDDPRLFITETETPPGIRDANFKRDLGIRQTTGDLVSLIDSDMVIPPDWMSNAVRLLMENEVDCVAGVMRSIHDDFWGRFVDGNRLGAKTPRAEAAYLVTAEGFGAAGYKPPITADILFTKKMYEDCPIDGNWSHGSLEDYEWFWRVVERGHKVLVSNQLFGWHHHRAGFKKLTGEYRRSARGCAYFIRAHRESPFAQKRMTQAVILPLAAFGFLLGLAGAVFMGYGVDAAVGLGALAVAGTLLLSGREYARSRSLESLLYPVPGLILGLNYTASLATHLVLNGPMQAITMPTGQPATGPSDSAAPRRRARILSPLTFLLAVQAGLSLSLVWSNTAFGDEALYLWEGHLEWRHWLHGSEVGVFHDSGAPQIYPVIGAIADKLGGLAGARILSLLFMLAAAALLYAVGERLFGPVAAFSGTALWVVSEPVLRLAFATYDALACLLMITAVYLAMRSAYATRKGELVLASGLCLAVASATAESYAIMIPALVVVSLFIWRTTADTKSAVCCAAWQGATAIAVTVGLLSVLHLWQDAIDSTITRPKSAAALGQGISLVLRAAWSWDGLILGLAIAGAVVALRSGRGALVTSLALSILLVPLYQAHIGTAFSMDKHMSVGTALAALAAGYGISRLRLSAPISRGAGAVAVAALLLVPAVTGLWFARATFHDWPNVTRLTAVSRQFNPHEPVLVNSQNGNFTINLFNYYLPNNDWVDNNGSEYKEIEAGGYAGVITALDGQADLASAVLTQATGSRLVEAVEDSHHYAIVAVIPYVTANSADSHGIFVVWRRVPLTRHSTTKGSATKNGQKHTRQKKQAHQGNVKQ
jgi:putative flippase GtrA/glycosyltransferase involved in cell wall biosynthesis